MTLLDKIDIHSFTAGSGKRFRMSDRDPMLMPNGAVCYTLDKLTGEKVQLFLGQKEPYLTIDKAIREFLPGQMFQIGKNKQDEFVVRAEGEVPKEPFSEAEIIPMKKAPPPPEDDSPLPWESEQSKNISSKGERLEFGVHDKTGQPQKRTVNENLPIDIPTQEKVAHLVGEAARVLESPVHQDNLIECPHCQKHIWFTTTYAPHYSKE